MFSFDVGRVCFVRVSKFSPSVNVSLFSVKIKKRMYQALLLHLYKHDFVKGSVTTHGKAFKTASILIQITTIKRIKRHYPSKTFSSKDLKQYEEESKLKCRIFFPSLLLIN